MGRWLSPEEVAAAIVDGTQLNKTYVFVPKNLEISVKIGQ